jgi:hypothetical protein
MLILQLAVLVCTWVYIKFVAPNIPKDTINEVTSKVNLIVQYADSFVAWAKQFMKSSSGTEKMEEVVKQLSNIAEKYDIDISEEEIRAIAQKAYDMMKAEDKRLEADTASQLVSEVSEVRVADALTKETETTDTE